MDTLIPLAEGAIGRVYRSRNTATGEIVAVKLLRNPEPAQIERMRREAAAQQRLDHPNICRVKTLEQDEEGRWRLIMEYVAGSTLAREFNRLTLEQRVHVLKTVCEAVAHAHASGVLHRDLKPANILIRNVGEAGREPVVADFGLALGDDDPALTTTGEILGSPAYMSPEQALGGRDRVGPGSDVFSIGCILYEALTGRPPFEAESVSASLDRLLNEDASHPRKSNPHAPEALSRIALQCLERAPARRYSSAAEVAEDLERWELGQSVSARRYTTVYRLRRSLRRHPAASAASALAVLTVLALLAWGIDTARTAGLREASAATLGNALADVRSRMTIARLAPAHDIGTDRAALRADLEQLEASQPGRATTTDLLHTTLAAGFLEIGDLVRAERHARRALAARDTPMTRAIRGRTLLQRHARIVAAVMDLPEQQRAERLDAAREAFLLPAQRLIEPLRGTADAPADALARLAIVARRFDEAASRIHGIEPMHPQGYTPQMLAGALQMARAEAALESADRNQASELFGSARRTFEALTVIGRSDPRPRLQACRAARGHLRASMERGGPFPDSLAELAPGCHEVAVIDPGNPDSHAARASAFGTLAAAQESVNRKGVARRLVRAGLNAALRATDIAPDHARALESRARLYLRLAGLEPEPWSRAQAHFDAAADAALQLQAVRPDDPVGLLLAALVERDRARHLDLHGQGEAALAALDDARAAFEALLARTPDSIVALSGAALNAVFHFYEFRPRDPEKAVDWMERAIALQGRALAQDPDNVDLLFDQGANHGDLWYYLLLTPEVDARWSRDQLLTRALELLEQMRRLAPALPGGYSQPIMILLSGADYRLDHGLDAGAMLDRALALQKAAARNDVTLDRNIPAWIHLARARNVLAQGGDAGPVFESAWPALDPSNVDESDRFYLRMHRLEMIALYQRWLRQTGGAPDVDRFAEAHAALESLLDNQRRQAGVLCNGGRLLFEEVLAGLAPPGPALRRADALFEECIETDDDFLPRFGDDLTRVSERLSAGSDELPGED